MLKSIVVLDYTISWTKH